VKKIVTSLPFNIHIAPLVVIFTKRDGAIAKVTSQIIQDNSSSSESTISRAFKKQARAKAEMEVTECVKKREEELKQLSKANSAVMFLTTSGTPVSWLSPVENC
jgi:tRNA pseudouridine-54 N-methylase